MDIFPIFHRIQAQKGVYLQMKTMKILCAGLVAAMLFTGCKATGNGASDLGSDISSGISKVESGVNSGMSNLESDMNSGISDGKSDLNSTTSDKNTDKNHSSESAPVSGASSDVAAEIHISPATVDLSTLDGTKQGWGQGVQLDDQNRPISALQFQKKYGKYDAYFIGNDEKIIYLTFDEGYENGYTATILDTLKEKNVPAVFFVTMDYAKKEADLIKRMVEEGHAIGNHSDKHVSYPTVSTERCKEETLNLHNYIDENFGYKMTLFRPPMGEFSERVLAQTQQLGYKTMLWSYAYKDWEANNQMDPAKALEKVNGALHNGAIYLLHAVGSTNDEILGDFIDYARSQGYEFKLFQ